MIYMDHVFLIYSPVDVHFACFHFVALVVATHMGVKIFLHNTGFISFQYTARTGIAGSCLRKASHENLLTIPENAETQAWSLETSLVLEFSTIYEGIMI